MDHSLPEAGVLLPYIGWATLALAAGMAFTIVSVVVNSAISIGRAVEARRYRILSERREEQELRANLTSLNIQEAKALCQLLESGAARFSVPIWSTARLLVDKRMLRPVGGTGTELLCELPKPLLAHKEEIIAEIKKALEQLKNKD